MKVVFHIDELEKWTETANNVVVPAGVLDLIDLKAQGYAYIKP